MAIIKQLDKRSGITYVYESTSYWDKEKQQPRSKRKLIGRLDPDTGEITKAWLFVGVMTYSQYPYVEAFLNEKQQAWITAHVHMYEYFGGVTRILVPDNCKTAVIHNNDWYNQQVNQVYYEMAEDYNTAIIPARVRSPKDKANAEGAVGIISTWITAALRNEQFFSLAELNRAIRKKLEIFSHRPFQKKEGSRYEY